MLRASNAGHDISISGPRWTDHHLRSAVESACWTFSRTWLYTCTYLHVHTTMPTVTRLSQANALLTVLRMLYNRNSKLHYVNSWWLMDLKLAMLLCTLHMPKKGYGNNYIIFSSHCKILGMDRYPVHYPYLVGYCTTRHYLNQARYFGPTVFDVWHLLHTWR